MFTEVFWKFYLSCYAVHYSTLSCPISWAASYIGNWRLVQLSGLYVHHTAVCVKMCNNMCTQRYRIVQLCNSRCENIGKFWQMTVICQYFTYQYFLDNLASNLNLPNAPHQSLGDNLFTNIYPIVLYGIQYFHWINAPPTTG